MAIAMTLGPHLGGCAAPIGIPPLRGEIGGSAIVGEPGRALHAGGGAHYASATLGRAVPVDFGAGGFVEVATAGTTTAGYVDGALFVDRSPRTRTSLGARGELRRSAGGFGAGAHLRIDHELYAPSQGPWTAHDRCCVGFGFHHGTSAIGVYVDAGRVWQPEGAAWTASAGVTLRIPSVVGVLVGIPGCK